MPNDDGKIPRIANIWLNAGQLAGFSCEKVCDEPIAYFIDGPDTHLEVVLELGTRVPATQHRLTISDETNVLYEVRFFSQDPESLLQTITEAIVNEAVKPTQLHEFVFQFGGSCLTLPEPLVPTPPKSSLN